MFKVLNENTVVGVSEEYPKARRIYEIVEDTEHTVDDYVQINGEYVLKTSDEAIEQRKKEVRSIRNQYLFDTDKYMIADFPVSKDEKADYKAYRQYLRDCTEQEDWYEQPPMTFEEWKAQNESEVGDESIS